MIPGAEFVNDYGDKLTMPSYPDHYRLVYYHLYTHGKKNQKAVPIITVGLVVVNYDSNITTGLSVLGRGITICSPDDIPCFNKKEGRIRAGARALRAVRKATNGTRFKDKRAKDMIRAIFGTGNYGPYRWVKRNIPNQTLKYEYMPELTVHETTLLALKFSV